MGQDKYTKFILRHLANDNINKGSEILAAEIATEPLGASKTNLFELEQSQ